MDGALVDVGCDPRIAPTEASVHSGFAMLFSQKAHLNSNLQYQRQSHTEMRNVFLASEMWTAISNQKEAAHGCPVYIRAESKLRQDCVYHHAADLSVVVENVCDDKDEELFASSSRPGSNATAPMYSFAKKRCAVGLL